MRRLLAISAVIALGMMLMPTPARAADCASLDLGPLLNVTADCQVLDLTGNVVGEVTGGVVEIVREITIPGPTVTVTAPPPAPATVTRTVTPPTVTRAGPTQTETQAPTTVTQTAPQATITITRSGQASATSATVVATPTVAAPPADKPGIDVLPDSPTAAAATGSIFGLLIGLMCAFLLMFIAYRRGQAAGEEKSLRDFLGYLRGTPEPGRHRG